jgi:hypothetical protein
MDPSRRLDPLMTAAMGSSAILMAYQVASRATRDTLFLTNFNVSSLPVVIAVTSVLSIVVAILATRGMATLGPARLIPMAFMGSALLTIGEWVLAARQPGLAAIAVYLHVGAIAPVLISGLWSILNEHFDPRTAKQAIGRIAAAGTLGGLAGGLVVERLAAWMGVNATLPALAVAQACCAWSIRRMPSAGAIAERPPVGQRLPAREVGRRLLVTPYLRNLALLVLGCSVSNTLLDYVFKAQTSGAVYQNHALMQVFSAFYAGVAILTFAIQVLFSRLALERAGIAPTIGTLPAVVVVGSVSATLIPGPWSIAVARGLEAILRGSLFRAGYELLYTPVPAAEKRATKTLVDIGCDRIGDIVGAGITALVLVAAPFASTPALLALSALIAAATLWLVAQLQRGYVSSLEAGLRAGALDISGIQIGDLTTRTILLRTIRGAGSTVFGPSTVRAGAHRVTPARVVDAPTAFESDSAVLERLRALRPDELGDVLVDPSVDVRVRRRIPALLAADPSTRAIDVLTVCLTDRRFEVRYRCGRALARLLIGSPGLTVDPGIVFDAVRREATLGRHVWDSQRLLDRLEKTDEDSFVDEFLRDRAGRSLEHTFTLLSLVLPREPLQIAFRGLHAGDVKLRGTALEYLESVLPADVREPLWPYLEPERRGSAAPRPPRDREQVLNDLLHSHGSIVADIEALRQRRGTA